MIGAFAPEMRRLLRRLCAIDVRFLALKSGNGVL
jgi:hypothetical protein